MCTGIKVLAFTAHRNAVGSYPSCVRGLKRLKGPTSVEMMQSYPSWVRGLKNGGRKDEQRRI